MMKGLKRLQAGIGIAAVAGALAFGTGQACAAEYEVRMPVEKTVRLAAPDDAAASAAAPAAKPDSAAKPDAVKSGAPKTALGRAAEAAAANAAKPAAAPKGVAPAVKAAEAAPAASDAAPAKSADKSNAKPAAKAKKSAKPAHDANPHALSADPDALAEDSGVVHVPSGAPIPVPVPGVAESAPATEKSMAKPVAKAAPAPKPEPKLDPKAGVMPPAPAGAPTPIALPADGQWVGDVDIEFQADRIILRAATNAAVERVTWFNLTNPAEPRKLAIDLRGPWRKKGNAVLRYDTGPVKAVVTGEHPDRLRLAVEFRDGAVAPQLEPVLENGPKGVSLTIPLAVRLAR